MIEIKRWDTGDIIYTSAHATEVAYALIEAVRAGADLYRARLYRARLDEADLDEANLVGASLDEADLDRANLDDIRKDVRAILNSSPNEVPALREALVAGRFDGSHYQGDCACLVGTIANARGCYYEAIPGLYANPDRPAERWALAIRAGDTAQTNPVAAITLQWVDEWLAERPSAATPEAAP